MKNLYFILILFFTVNINAVNNDYLRKTDRIKENNVTNRVSLSVSNSIKIIGQQNLYHHLDFGARMYDPVIARWSTQDPMKEKYYGIGQYVYVANNPISFVDPTGMLATRYEDEDGNLLLNTDDGSDAIITVSEDKMNAFVWSVTHTTEENIHSKSWNDSWKKALTGFEWTGVHERTISSTHSDASKRALVRAWQTGKFTDYLKFYAAELGGQWTDPELVSQGILSGLIGYATVTTTVKGGAITVDDLIKTGTKMNRVKAGRQVSVKGDIDDIINSFAKDGKRINLPDGRVQVKLPDGTTITKYSGGSGLTLQINQGGKITKVRIE